MAVGASEAKSASSSGMQSALRVRALARTASVIFFWSCLNVESERAEFKDLNHHPEQIIM